MIGHGFRDPEFERANMKGAEAAEHERPTPHDSDGSDLPINLIDLVHRSGFSIRCLQYAVVLDESSQLS